MPLYEYECDACGHRFEAIRKFSDPPLEECPKCSGLVRKLQSSPAFHLKGSGWYITDYARKDSKDGDTKDSNESSTKDTKESKDSKAETKDAKESTKDTKDSGSTESKTTSDAKETKAAPSAASAPSKSET